MTHRQPRTRQTVAPAYSAAKPKCGRTISSTIGKASLAPAHAGKAHHTPAPTTGILVMGAPAPQATATPAPNSEVSPHLGRLTISARDVRDCFQNQQQQRSQNPCSARHTARRQPCARVGVASLFELSSCNDNLHHQHHQQCQGVPMWGLSASTSPEKIGGLLQREPA